jgi:hypothetical protein
MLSRLDMPPEFWIWIFRQPYVNFQITRREDVKICLYQLIWLSGRSYFRTEKVACCKDKDEHHCPKLMDQFVMFYVAHLSGVGARYMERWLHDVSEKSLSHYHFVHH